MAEDNRTRASRGDVRSAEREDVTDRITADVGAPEHGAKKDATGLSATGGETRIEDRDPKDLQDADTGITKEKKDE